MPPVISIEDRGPTRLLTIDRPRTKNAIPTSGWLELLAALDGFAASAARVLVIRGRGGDFCSGADLSDAELEDLDGAALARKWMGPVGEVATTLHRLPKPTIAAVDGVAVGAGLNLAIGCDIVLATDRARFSELFVRQGLTLDLGGTWLLPRHVGLARARDMALTGRFVDAEEAERIGLVARVVPANALDAAVDETVDALCAGAGLAQRMIKSALDRSSAMTFEQAIDLETQSQTVLLGSFDVAEARTAFKEKRPPRFEGR